MLQNCLPVKNDVSKTIPEKIDLNLNYYKIENFFVDIEEMVESFVERPALGQVGP